MEYNHLEYVRKYFKLYYGTYYNRLNKNENDILCLEISKRVRDKYDNLKLLSVGSADKFISSIINSYVNKEHFELRADYINLRNYVTKLIHGTRFVNCSIDTLDVIVEGACDMLMPTYSYRRMNDGEMDDNIISAYNVCLSDLAEEIRLYIDSYLSLNVAPLTDIDNKEVADEVFKLILNTSDISVLDLLLGRQNEIINDLVERNREKNRSKRLAEMPDVFGYIRKNVEVYTDDVELVNNIINQVEMDLRDEGLLPSEIISGKYNMKIRQMFNEYYSKRRKLFILDNSIEKDNVPDKIEQVGRKVDINKVISQLLVASALLGFISYGGYSIGKEIRTSKAEKNLSKFDSYGYTNISNIYVDSFKATAENVIETFNDYCQFDNSNFNYLGFYRAYRSVLGSKLYVMDNMLSEVKHDISTDIKYRNSDNKIKPEYSSLRSAINTNGCYLDFVYDRLYEMGFTEVKEKKYFELLEAYLKERNEHPYGDPVEHLTNSQQRLLNKVMDKYIELSEQHLLEFGVLLGDQNNVQEKTSSVRRH